MRKFFLLTIVCVAVFSCATKKEILYFQDAESLVNTSVDFDDVLILPNHILQVNITAFPNEPALPYNRVPMIRTGNVRDNIVDGYLVTNEGYITLPILGNVFVEGQSIVELQETIRQVLVSDGHLKNPVVEVRILNNRFTILGEVGSPGVYTFYENNFTIFQALGLSGDLPISGKRMDIRIIRELEGRRSVSHLDLTSADIFKSPYYYIKPNDLIYVEPSGPKVKSAGYIGNLGSLLSVFSILLSTFLILTR